MTETRHLSALDLAAALRRGEADAREHTEAVLRAAREEAAPTGAFAHLLAERSRAQAERAQTRLEAARTDPAAAAELARRSPLLGVPVPVKDLSRIAGEPFEAGSAVLRGTIAEVTDGVPALLEDAGTVTIGKTSTPEFGMPCYTEPAHAAPARTPWDLRRTAGGSSGGAAAAVAAGIVPLAHGSDGGGSVRIPAACCGVVGMKPSRGVVSPGPYGAEGPGLVSDGMIARTVRDVAAGLDAIAGSRPGDAYPAPLPPGGFLAALQGREQAQGRRGARAAHGSGGLRIGVLTQPLNIDTPVHPAALRAVERASEALRGAGHELVELSAPFTPEQWRTFMPLWTVGAASIPLPPEAEQQLMPLTRWLRAQGRAYDGVAVSSALAGMQALARTVGQAFASVDAVLTPSLSGPPAFPADLQLADPAADFDAQCAFTPWTSTWNMTGRAAISVPVHREEIDGTQLPFGAHIGAVRAGDDVLVLALAELLEAEDPWPLVREVAA
ncbi:amidase [Brachybacterium phenoliresistens]|uniref:amidase n=1 Tax=Brachybacterium phenoliresistens TaxID=396014 RepID=UPI0031E40407